MLGRLALVLMKTGDFKGEISIDPQQSIDIEKHNYHSSCIHTINSHTVHLYCGVNCYTVAFSNNNLAANFC
jgi:hypothetical protein